MTEEDLKKLESEQTPKEEPVASEEVPEVSNEPSPEDIAKEKGWLPKEEYQGDPETWVDASEFLAREPLYKAIHKQSRENKRLMQMNQEIKKLLQSVKKTSYEQALKDLQRQYEAAAENNDVKTAVEVHSKIKEIEQEAAAPVVSEPEDKVPTAFREWSKDNKWYIDDPVLKRYADGVGAEIGAAKLAEKGDGERLSEDELLEVYNEVTRIVKKDFPDKFQNKNRARPSTVNEPSRRTPAPNTNVKKKLPTFDDLPEEVQEIYKLVVKSKSNPRGAFDSGEEYIQAYLDGGGTLKDGVIR